MASIGSGQLPKSMFPGIRLWWGVGYKRLPEVYSKVFYVDKSEKSHEDDAQMLGFPSIPVKAEGDGVYYVSTQEGRKKRYSWTSYALGFIVTREAKDDHMYGLIQKLSRAMGDSCRHTLETVHANIINRAFNTAYTGADTKALCVSDHPSAATGASMSNVPSTPATLSYDMIDQARIDVGGMTDDNGILMALGLAGLLVPKELVSRAKQLLDSPMNAETMNNMVNVFHKEVPIIEWKYLTNADSYFFLTDLDREEGLKSYWRTRWEMAQTPDFDTLGTKNRVFGRFGGGWTNHRKIYGVEV